jgi:hypothetical protein
MYLRMYLLTMVAVLGLCVCLCLSAAILQQQATRHPISDMNDFKTTRA